jgi:NADH-quinone oxidoreductase subunit H
MTPLAMAAGGWPIEITGMPVLDGFLCIFIVCFILINFIAVYAGVSTYAERKVAGHMQARVGPYRIWWHGFGVWIADALKLMIKEDIIAKETDKLLFKLSPYVVFAGSFACWVALPYIPGWSPASFNIGILYLLAVSSAVVIGILMAGWSSGSKWALFGAMRSAAQIVSYEVPIGITLLGMLLIYGTLDMQAISAAQEHGMPFGIFDTNSDGSLRQGGLWSWGVNRYGPFTFVAFLIYYIGALAETNRTPFDIPEAESELVAGYHTEYSGMRFSFFFLSEYANMFVVSAIATTFFLGGWLPPFPSPHAAICALVGGGALAALAYGYKKRGFDATVGLFVGSGLGVLYSVISGPHGEVHPQGFLAPPDSVGRAIEGGFWFVSKCFALIFVMMWLRWTLPRYRVDQLMDLCWKKLTPLAFTNLVVIGLLETRHEWMKVILDRVKGGGH